MKLTLNDKAWAKLFSKYNILENIKTNSYFEITSTQINEFRQARLMTKFDQENNLPLLFSTNQLSILPVTRGSYIIGRFNTYEEVKYDSKIETVSFSIPSFIESIDTDNIYSEATALNTVFAGKVINEILEEEAVQTISGRMGTGEFSFDINSHDGPFNVDVKNSQCEIDAGFESPNKLLLLEAKNFKIDSFNIRQMYYPYRLWKGKVNKEIVPAFFTFSNDIFSFFIYKFNDTNNYNSLELIEQRNFAFAEEPISIDDIFNILREVPIIEEPTDVPFPQANNFERTIDLLGLLMEENLSKDDIASFYNFEKRQADYYANAGTYLGLIKKGDPIELTPLGKQIMSMKHREKKLSIARAILEHNVFNRVMKRYFETLSPVLNSDIVDIMNDSYLHNVREQSTVIRRASTVKSWIEWILNLAE